MYYVIIYRVFGSETHKERYYGSHEDVVNFRAFCICLGHATSGVRFDVAAN